MRKYLRNKHVVIILRLHVTVYDIKFHNKLCIYIEVLFLTGKQNLFLCISFIKNLLHNLFLGSAYINVTPGIYETKYLT